MRAFSEAGSPAWPMRICKPWLVATAGGLAIGASLLSFDSAEFPSSYPESAPRAAVYDAPAFTPPAAPAAPARPVPAVEPEGVFAPAEAVAAFASLTPAEEPAPTR